MGPLPAPEPSFRELRRVVLGEALPRRVHLAELLFDDESLASLAQRCGVDWVPYAPELAERHWRATVSLWHRLGYDYVRVSRSISFPGLVRKPSSGVSSGSRDWVEEGQGIIGNWKDFDAYPWPQNADFSRYEYVSRILPDGMAMMVSPCAGVFETVAEKLLGFEGMSYLLADDPDLVAAVFQKVGELFESFYRQVVQLDNVGGFFQGDDFGYRSSLLASPSFLRRFVLPWHRKYAEIAHRRGKMYWLHSCGNVAAVMEDLLSDVRIDAFHSFQDEVLPVTDFCRRYGSRVAALGGVDMDNLCRLSEEDLRGYVRGILSSCMPGRFALGTGNSVARYVPVDNFLAMLEEARRWG